MVTVGPFEQWERDMTHVVRERIGSGSMTAFEALRDDFYRHVGGHADGKAIWR